MSEVSRRSPQVWSLIARELWRKLKRRLRAGPAVRWRYSGRTPDRILMAPPDLRLADPQVATDMYYGRFLLAGRLVDTKGQSPFQIETASEGFQRALHGFRWLRHMRAARTDIAFANARSLVSDWISLHGRHIAGVAWEPGATAQRIIAWLQHSPVVLQGAEFPFYRVFLKSLAIQVRYLRSSAREMPDGTERLQARIALAFSALALPTPASAMRKATRNLAEELDRQVLPDGGHVSRNPGTVVELLTDLLPLRQTYANQAEAPPQALIGAIERLLPAVRFFRHEDGSLARFNGMGATAHERIAAILRHDDTIGAPLLSATHSGYQRLSLGGTTVIADTGAPPSTDLSGLAHAGCLSFEMSSGRRSVIVNSGIDAGGAADFHLLARATAAHSTATLNDTSSARFTHSSQIQGILGTPLIGGPRHVPCERADVSGVQRFVASHDGYLARFGLYHERELALGDGGATIEGVDRFFRAGGAPPRDNGRDHAMVRFHLHPDQLHLADERDRLVISSPGADRWTFECEDVTPAVEESIFFAGIAGPRRSRQIVLSFRASQIPEVHWRLTRSRPEGEAQAI